MHTQGDGITRRRVLQAAGGVLGAGALGVQPAGAQDGCEGSPTESIPPELPEISLLGEQATARNLPTGQELLVYLHGFSTTPADGRRLAATFESALPADAPPVVAAPWRAIPEQTESEGAFPRAEQNADEDGRKLAVWLDENAGEQTVRLVGYSLGTRTALSAVDALAEETVDLASVSLLGSAVPGAQVCAEGGYDLSAARAVFSYRSENDRVLCSAFAGYLISSDADPPAVGCKGPDCDLPAHFVDRDVSETIKSHCAYSYPEVGVVPQVATDFTRPLSAVDRAGEPPEDTPTDHQTDTPDEDTETDSSAGPGFGIGGALAGLGGAGYLLDRLSDS